MMKVVWNSIVVASAVATGIAAAPQNTPSRSRVAIARGLPSLDGQHLEATLVEVTYEPGGANKAHRHPCPDIGYVLEGSLRMQVEGQPERIYTPGETFYEAPTDVHLVSANASAEKPARFLAYFVCDHPTPLSVPVPEPRGGGK